MHSPDSLLILLLLLPVVGIASVLCGPIKIGSSVMPHNPKFVAFTVALLNFILSILAWVLYFDPKLSGPQLVTNIPWISLPGLFTEIHFHVGIDGINLPLLLLTTTVTLAAVSVVPDDIKRPREFFSYLLLMSLGAIGAFISYDLFFLYIFHEFALIPTFLLIGIWGTQNRQFASMQLTLYLTLGSLVLLAGVLGLVFTVGYHDVNYHPTFDLTKIQSYLRDPATHSVVSPISQGSVYGLLLIGFGVLISLVPFHSWAAPGYAAAPPSVAMMHAGVLKKFGLYGLIRIAIPLLPGGPNAAILNCPHFTLTWHGILLVLLLGNILYVGLATLAQKELQTMLGFSSVMHMGYLFLGIAAANALSLSGVILLMVAHGLSASLLFGLAGEIQQRTGENRFTELGGLARRAPFLVTAFVLGSLASIGLPGLANFPGEILIFFGAAAHGSTIPPVVVFLALWGVVLSAVYQLRAVRRIFFGDLPVRFENMTDVSGFAQRAPYALLLAALFFLGLVPSALLSIITPAIKALLP